MPSPHTTPPAVRPGDPPAWQQGVLQRVGRRRRVGLPLFCAVLFLASFADGAWWREALLGTTFAMALGMVLWEFRLARHPREGGLFVIATNSAVVLWMVIVATGGLLSPFLMGLSVAMLAAHFTHEGPGVRRFIAPQVAGLVALLVAQGLGVDLLPRRMWGPYRATWPMLCTSALCLLVALLIASALGRWLRASVLRHVREVQAAHDSTRRAHEEHAREMGDLMAEIAHEIKNPLTTVSGTAALMARAPGDARNAERLAVLRAEVERMRELVEQFVTSARPLSRLRCGPVELVALGRDVLLLHESVAAERGVALVLEGPGPLMVVCDERKVKQVLINLVQNGLHAAPRGSTLTLRIERRGGLAALAISDEGPGLDPEVAARLFTPGVTTRSDGAGLGLCLSRGLARQHGGELTLRPADGGGCVAELTLPLAAAAAALESAA